MKHYYHRFSTLLHKFRIYDCGEQGYKVLADGKFIGVADSLPLAERMAKNYV
jgi:hypothetical protein